VYVFVSFGLHHCVNILTSGEKPAGCVLLRSIEPLAGIRRMKANRQTSDVRQLTSGPGRLTEALGITKDLNGTSIVEGPLLIVDCDDFGPFVPTVDVRIGLTKDRNYPLRYLMSNNQYVSHPRSKFFANGE
jgi:DNA-3-methyladenine glycosylase